jgi:hypothetical protein
MLDLSKIPAGTALIWDAPEPFKGYSRNIKHPNRVFYPARVTEQDPKMNRTRVATSSTQYGRYGQWMSYDSEWLRYPTAEELLTEDWSKLTVNL